MKSLRKYNLYLRGRLFAVLAGVVVCLSMANAMARPSEFTLFNEPGSPPAFAAKHARSFVPGGFPRRRRSRPVNVDSSVAMGKGVGLSDTLVLNLFDDVHYSADIDRLKTNVNGTVMIRGRLKDYPLGTVLMSTTNGRTTISIEIPETGDHYIIQSEPENKSHYLLQLDPEAMDKLEDAPSPVPDAVLDAAADELLDESAAADDTAVNGPLDAVNIDVMIVYTPAAASWADSSGGGIENVIAQAMQKAELALDNSQAIMTMTLVYSGQVSYTESGDSGDDLDRLTNTSDGYMDGVHDLRDLYGADLVALYTEVDDTGGVGWLLNTTSGSPGNAFSISRVQQVGWTYTMIHEMGHNMGCHHHADQNYQAGPGLYSYSAGWRWTGVDDGKYCSVMSYESGDYFADGVTHSRVAYFSNPDVDYQSVPTGDATDGDNARTLREIKDVVAAYRAAVVPEPPTALTGSAQTQLDTPVTVTLNATDEGLPDPPGELSYIITSLPSYGVLTDPGAGLIDAVPYTLTDNGDQVVYAPFACFTGDDSFQFMANDGGVTPTGGDSNEALVTVSVLSVSVLYAADMDTDPGWTLDSGSDWAWGTPSGTDGDPDAGYTGANVVGYNLAGAYPKNMSSTVWATTPPVDCSGYTNVSLHFYRWLGVQGSYADDAYIQVSADGSSWTTVWSNPISTMIDESWTQLTYDISSVADNQPTVYLRWGLGPTSNNREYAGWNIDDVVISGQGDFTPLAGDFEPDCDVDADDLAVLIAYWLQACGDCEGADLLEDGIVNFADFQIFAQNWLATY